MGKHQAKKLYQSERWLKKKYHREKLSEKEIAEICNTSQQIINKWLRKFGLK